MRTFMYQGREFTVSDKRDKTRWFILGFLFNFIGFLGVRRAQRHALPHLRKTALKWTFYGVAVNTLLNVAAHYIAGATFYTMIFFS